MACGSPTSEPRGSDRAKRVHREVTDGGRCDAHLILVDRMVARGGIDVQMAPQATGDQGVQARARAAAAEEVWQQAALLARGSVRDRAGGWFFRRVRLHRVGDLL